MLSSSVRYVHTFLACLVGCSRWKPFEAGFLSIAMLQVLKAPSTTTGELESVCSLDFISWAQADAGASLTFNEMVLLRREVSYHEIQFALDACGFGGVDRRRVTAFGRMFVIGR
jgi:hypothetical protein